MNWGDFAEAAPDLAAEGEKRFDESGVILLGTLNKAGEPRISPVEHLVFEGHLLLGMMWQSMKALDLLRDPRCLVHNIITTRHGTEGEFKLRGRASEVAGADLRARYCVAMAKKIGMELDPNDDFHVFDVDVTSVALTTRDEKEQYVQRWP
jgi:hypothetical protein